MSIPSNPALPETWASVPLRDLGTWKGGGTPSKANASFWTNGTIPWVSPKDMKAPRIWDAQDKITSAAVADSATNVVPPGSILVVTRSGILAHTLPVAVAEVEVSLNQDLKALLPHEGLNSDYIALALEAFSDSILASCIKDGTTVSSVEFSKLLEYEIPLAPAHEQARIVLATHQQLSRLTAAAAQIGETRLRLKSYRAAVLRAACEGRLVPTEAELARAEGRGYESGHSVIRFARDERARVAHPSRISKMQPIQFYDGILLALPEGWASAKAEDLLLYVTSGSRGWAQHYAEDGELFLRVGNLDRLSVKLDLSQAQYVSPPADAEGTRTRVRPRDILVSITADVGMVAIVPEGLPPAYINQHVALARPTGAVDERYLAWYFANPEGGQRQYQKLRRGVTKAGLGLDDIQAVLVPIPPLAEQRRIVAEVERRLSVVERLEASIEANLARAKRLRQAILKRAFEGRLVPQDPRDEPASALLERIRKEREATGATKRNGAKKGPTKKVRAKKEA